MIGTPPADIDVDAGLVRGLIARQFPEFADQGVIAIGNGWDNAMFRVGDRLAARLPRRAVAAKLIEHEQRWLPVLAPRLPLPVPAPLHCGQPDCGYPWRWSIVPWLTGSSADASPPDPQEAGKFGAFLAALHCPAPCEAPTNPVRGVPLADRAETVELKMEQLRRRTNLVSGNVKRRWHDALSAPPSECRYWLHGDLHPQNILTSRGSISGVIDWGDITAGDVATDLAALWMLFDAPERSLALDRYGGADTDTLARAQGWAILFAVVLHDAGRRHTTVAAKTLRRLTRTLLAC